jgi:cyanophycinase-like exopeptidase
MGMDGNTNLVPGQVALLGSGETSVNGGRLFEELARNLEIPLKVSVLETPAGFELNSAQVAGRVADFIKKRLQNYQADVRIVPARKTGTRFSPDNLEILEPLLNSQIIFMGPGSPSYTVRQLSGSLAWDLMQARQRFGAALVFASAAAIAIGRLALPVYEIFKVGEDPHWKNGLDFFAAYGLDLIIVSHWNNTEGGADLDTSRCFIGQDRFSSLIEALPKTSLIVGIDEQTGLIMDFRSKTCHVVGQGQVHLLRGGCQLDYNGKEGFSIGELGAFHLPSNPAQNIRLEIMQAVLCTHVQKGYQEERIIPEDVQLLVTQRQQARASRNWSGADEIRRMIEELGWRVNDTPQGPTVERN